MRITEVQQRRWIKSWQWASTRWTGRATIILIALLMRVVFPGIWTSWFGTVVLTFLLIFAFGLFISIAIRAYHGKN